MKTYVAALGASLTLLGVSLALGQQNSAARATPPKKDSSVYAELAKAPAKAGKKGPSLRVEQVQSSEPGAIFWLLTNGVVRRGMPVWSKLPEPQRWQLVAYIKSLGVKPQPPIDSMDHQNRPLEHGSYLNP